MRAVVQRVSRAQVVVEGEVAGRIDRGLVVLLGVAQGDTADDVSTMAPPGDMISSAVCANSMWLRTLTA